VVTATERKTIMEEISKPVLMLARVLKVPAVNEHCITTPTYKLLPLAEVEMFPVVSRSRAEAEFLRLTQD
jgi:hypothetical protein